MARGGMRPTAPQNNPMNVNGRGGNGQSGTQAAKYVSGLPYGEGQALMQTQQAAPLAAAPSIEQSSMPSGLASAAASQPIIPLNAPSQRLDEPVTFGANAGPGPGISALGLGSATERTVADILAEVAQYDTTGEVQALYEQALLGGY
jgi:hypothetical protein